MPQIFDNIDQDLLPALRATIDVSDRSDFCVGYFNLRGWKQIASHIDRWGGEDGHCCRLLVGMQRLPQDELRRSLSVLSDNGGGIDNQTALFGLTRRREGAKKNRELGPKPLRKNCGVFLPRSISPTKEDFVRLQCGNLFPRQKAFRDLLKVLQGAFCSPLPPGEACPELAEGGRGRGPESLNFMALISGTEGMGETILIVDDERSVRAMLRRLLTDSGYTAIAVESARSSRRPWSWSPMRQIAGP